MAKVPMINKKRLIFAFGVFCLLLVCLCVRMGFIQIVQHDELSKMAAEQQTMDKVVEAKRGDIVDRNGNKLAVSTVKYSVWVRPASVKNSKKDSEIERDAENDAKMEEVVDGLSELLGVKKKTLRKELNSEKTLIKVAKYQERATVDAIRDWAAEKGIDGISISEENKRYYPRDEMAAQVLGSVTDDNNGLSGLELYYNGYLKGVPGRWIQEKDASGRTLSYGVEQYYEPEEGATVVTTLDVVIQSYAEEACRKTMKKHSADQVACIVMETDTGEILAMASTPGFDPNNPRTPNTSSGRAEFKQLKTEKDQLDYLNKMWRNPLVNDTYIPGSVFKVITMSMALEEDLTYPGEMFYDNGYIQVEDRKIKCVLYPDTHGSESAKKALRNSCNPVFVQLARRVGLDKFYSYMGLFGLDRTTGIDYPGEATSILQPKELAGPVCLATMGFGQGMALTPIQMVTAINAIANDGKMVQPHLVKEIRSADGEVIKTVEPLVVRQAVSAETAATMRKMMQFDVDDGGAGDQAAISGYKVGGKTATANIEAQNDMVINSYVCIGPVKNPQVTVLFIVWNPKDTINSTKVAVPGGTEVMENTLHYLNAESTQAHLGDAKTLMTVPDVTGMQLKDAKKLIKEQKLKYKISPEPEKEEDFTIVDQYPKGGETLEKGGTVYLYSE